jgi:uncharacterized integral membrane protein
LPDPERPPTGDGPEQHGASGPRLGRTRLSGAWTLLAVALALLVLLLVFILLNLNRVQVDFYGAHVRVPLAVALLFAVVLGSVLVFGLAAARMLQLRVRSRRLGRPVAPGADRTAPHTGNPERPVG